MGKKKDFVEKLCVKRRFDRCLWTSGHSGPDGPGGDGRFFISKSFPFVHNLPGPPGPLCPPGPPVHKRLQEAVSVEVL